MTEALLGLQWAVSLALSLLGLVALREWARRRDRPRGFLALAVALLAAVTLLGRLAAILSIRSTGVTAGLLTMLMGSGVAILLFRQSLVPLARRRFAAALGYTVAVTGAAVGLTVSSTGPVLPAAAVDLDVVLLLSWCALVGVVMGRLWRATGTLPRVQRARLRSLCAGFIGIVVAVLATAVSAYIHARTNSVLYQVIIQAGVLASTPLLAIAFAPPRWLRRQWREPEEADLRRALNDLLLDSPDAASLASRAVHWPARLLGGGGSLLVLNGAVVAFEGMEVAAARALFTEISEEEIDEQRTMSGRFGLAAVAPLRTRAGHGFLAVLAGPFTPLFGDEELQRLSQYVVSITVALDRVELVAGLRRNAELLDLAYDAVFSWDWGSRAVRYWNPSATELYGFTAEEVIGHNATPILQTDFPISMDRILEELLARGHWEGRVRQTAKDGRVLLISARWALQRDSEGQPQSVLEINRDISTEQRVADELRRARDAAQQASTAKSDYLSRMSHELRTPLAAMLGFSDLLEIREPRDDQVQAIQAIQRAGSHLLSLVNDVLDVARIESGRETLSLGPVAVARVVEETAGMVQQAASDRDITLGINPDGTENLYVRADRQRLVQVLLNLLSNAVKYGSEGGHIGVSARPEGQAVVIEVTDDGPGIDRVQQERLFQPFERLGAERSHVQGTGLGLALCRQLTQAMGGTVGVRSARGEGATFWVRLQRAEPQDQAAVVAAAGPAVLADERSESTVLYVEDNLATVALVESIFALRPRTRLITAMQGSLALDLAREHRPDLIILDLHLPDLNGDEVMHRLSDDPRTADIPVVIYSADATRRQVDRMMADGAVAYITKPARVPEFLAMLDNTLGDRSSRPSSATG